MGAQDKETGAPSGAPTNDEVTALIGEFDALKWAQLFARRFPGFDEGTAHAWFACAIMSGYDHKAKEQRNATETLTLKIDTGSLQAMVDEVRAAFEQYQAEHARLVRELNVALNGAVGAAPQASLCDIVAQVQRQQCVQVLNLADGMRINFRAPDGRRSTLHLRVLMDQWALDPDMTDVYEPMRAAIAAYPVAGEPLPVALDADHQTAAQVQALGASQVHPESALPSRSFDESFASDPCDDGGIREVINRRYDQGAQ